MFWVTAKSQFTQLRNCAEPQGKNALVILILDYSFLESIIQ